MALDHLSSARMRHMSTSRRAGGQTGNALVWAILGLIILAGMSALAAKAKYTQYKLEQGQAEAGILENLKAANNNAVLELLIDLQAGKIISRPSARTKGATVTFGPTVTTTVTPTGTITELVWSPKIAELRELGYLPEGWTADKSSLNNAPYVITWRRPVPCPPENCPIEGEILVSAPILDTADQLSPVDTLTVGPLLQRLGADGGISLPPTMMGPKAGRIVGYGGGAGTVVWDLPNPVIGKPAGVVAVRIGSGTNGFGQFVRIGDTRDPDLAGNLTVAKDVAVGGKTFLKGDLQMLDAAGNPCVHMTPSGQIAVGCSGEVTAKTIAATSATFSDGTPANKTTVGPNGITTTGTVKAEEVNAAQGLSANHLELRDAATEGTPCTSTGPAGSAQYAQLDTGGLATCAAGRWLALSRFGRAGDACATNGTVASDSSTSQGLICRGGRYILTTALMSNFVLVATTQVVITAGGPTSLNQPVCPLGGPGPSPQPLLMLAASNEDAPISSTTTAAGTTMVMSGINRYAVNTGGQWEVHMERADNGSSLPGTLVASIYCFYP